MSTRLSEFRKYLDNFGARAFDQLAVGRGAAALAAGEDASPPAVSPLDGFTAHWARLSDEEKTAFLKQATGPRVLRARKRRNAGAARKKAATAPSTGTKSTLVTAKGLPDAAGAADKKQTKAEKKAKKKEEKKAKKEAKAKAKEEKKRKKKAEKEKKAKETVATKSEARTRPGAPK